MSEACWLPYVALCLAAVLASALTLFSGFGLGTLLLPVFALFFPIDLAVGLTAIVHFLNNLFKLTLVGRQADRATVWRFGLPALGGALWGARMLVRLADLPPLTTYPLFGTPRSIMPVNVVVAALMIGFALFDLLPPYRHLAIDRRHLPLGGLLSGLFGGLSGHQGALRSAFLIKSGLSKEQFIGTGVVIACLVDVARLAVYWKQLSSAVVQHNGPLLVASTAAAFLGAWVGARWLHKVTVRGVQRLVAILLLLIAIGLGSGML